MVWLIVFALTRSPFNQTRMELKRDLTGLHLIMIKSFNQTRMELKQVTNVVGTGLNLPFNQTRMELKPSTLAKGFKP